MAAMGVAGPAEPADTEQLVGALIPPATRRRPTPTVPMFVPPLPPAHSLPANPQAWQLGLSQPDASGRLSIRHLLTVLGWSPGDRIDQTVIGDAVVITRSPTGRATIGTRGEIMIPAAIRALAGLDNARQVLLVATPEQNILVAHAESVAATLLAEHYTHPDAHDDG